MSVSAVGKTPTEIWASILSMLLRTPLLPQDDVTIAESLAAFSYDCDFDNLQRELCRVSTVLRLVCRSWDRLVQRIHPTVVIANLNTQYVKSVPIHVLPALLIKGNPNPKLQNAQRLEIWTPFECNCGQECRSALPSRTVERLQKKEIPIGRSSSNPFNPAQDLIRLEVINAKHYMGIESPISLLDRTPNLKVLSWAGEWTDAFFKTLIRHRIHQNLTHLKISLLWDHIHSLGSIVPFPNLRFLHFSILDRGFDATARKSNELGLENWAAFPRLQRLHLRLYINQLQSRKDDLVAFLKAIGTNLSGLIYDVYGNASIWFEPDLWDLLPSLTEFGVADNLITSEPPPPPSTMKPLNLIYRFSDRADEITDISPENTMVDQFIDVCKQWRTEKMTMLQSWREAEIMMAEPIDEHSEYVIGTHVEFYERLAALGVVISDRDGVSIGEPEGQRFLEALKEYEPRRLAEEQRRRDSESESGGYWETEDE